MVNHHVRYGRKKNRAATFKAKNNTFSDARHLISDVVLLVFVQILVVVQSAIGQAR